jgi:D-alanine-D-alanine ligase
MPKLTVAVLFGGMSNEHEVSVVSAKNVISQMPKDFTILPIYITKDGRWFLYDGPLSGLTAFIDGGNWERQGTSAVLSADRTHRGFLRIVGGKVKPIPVDCVFPVMHGRYGEDGCIQGLCELAGIPCVGSGVLSSAICMDKTYAKIVAKHLGVRVSDYVWFKRDASFKEIAKRVRYKIGYPCFVKPANGGSSVGIGKVNHKSELEAALAEAFEHDDKVIVEKFVKGRELECAVIGTPNGKPLASRVGEIISGNEWYDYEAKYNDVGSQTLIDPQGLPEAVAEEIRGKSSALFEALDCEGLARVDFFYDEAAGKVYFSELNTMPGFTGISMFAMLWKADGIDHAEVIMRLVMSAMEK